ncbi:hypothetical protein RQP46_008746 [Phenoliferia psychrophenolica]
MPPINLKLVVIGDGGVGKSSITTALLHREFSDEWDPTIEDSYSVNLTVDGQEYAVELVDTAGQEEYRGLWGESTVREGDGFLLCYAIDSQDSFDLLPMFMHTIRKVKSPDENPTQDNTPENTPFPFMIIGNKCDVPPSTRQISASTALSFSRSAGGLFFETSAKLRVNIDAAFASIVRATAKSTEDQSAPEEQHVSTPETSSPLSVPPSSVAPLPSVLHQQPNPFPPHLLPPIMFFRKRSKSSSANHSKQLPLPPEAVTATVLKFDQPVQHVILPTQPSYDKAPPAPIQTWNVQPADLAFSSYASTDKLRVLIVGAGFAGLSAAIACARQGFAVTVLERSSGLSPHGDAISIGANAAKVLYRWGLGDELWDRSCQGGWWLVTDSNGKPLMEENLADFPTRFGAPVLNGHRAQYLGSLGVEARFLGCTIRLDTSVEEYYDTPSYPAVVCKSGEVIEADVILVADGINSISRELLAPRSLADLQERKTSEYSIHRAAMRSDAIRADKTTAHLLDGCTRTWIGKDAHAVITPLDGGKQIAFQRVNWHGYHRTQDPSRLSLLTLRFYGHDAELFALSNFETTAEKLDRDFVGVSDEAFDRVMAATAVESKSSVPPAEKLFKRRTKPAK